MYIVTLSYIYIYIKIYVMYIIYVMYKYACMYVCKYIFYVNMYRPMYMCKYIYMYIYMHLDDFNDLPLIVLRHLKLSHRHFLLVPNCLHSLKSSLVITYLRTSPTLSHLQIICCAWDCLFSFLFIHDKVFCKRANSGCNRWRCSSFVETSCYGKHLKQCIQPASASLIDSVVF